MAVDPKFIVSTAGSGEVSAALCKWDSRALRTLAKRVLQLAILIFVPGSLILAGLLWWLDRHDDAEVTNEIHP